MDGSRFDALTRSLSAPGSRRRVIAWLVGGAFGLVGFGREAAACRPDGSVCREHANCCTRFCGPKDRTGRQTCACRGSADCRAPDACHEATCVDGRCTFTPTIDFANDEANCGRCGRVCPTDPHGTTACQNGVCTLACDAGYALGPGDALACGLLDLWVQLTNNWDTTVIAGHIDDSVNLIVVSNEVLFFDRPPTDAAPRREAALSVFDTSGPLAVGQQWCGPLPGPLEVGTTLDETQFIDSLGRVAAPTGTLGPLELAPGLTIDPGTGVLIEFRDPTNPCG